MAFKEHSALPFTNTLLINTISLEANHSLIFFFAGEKLILSQSKLMTKVRSVFSNKTNYNAIGVFSVLSV